MKNPLLYFLLKFITCLVHCSHCLEFIKLAVSRDLKYFRVQTIRCHQIQCSAQKRVIYLSESNQRVKYRKRIYIRSQDCCKHICIVTIYSRCVFRTNLICIYKKMQIKSNNFNNKVKMHKSKKYIFSDLNVNEIIKFQVHSTTNLFLFPKFQSTFHSFINSKTLVRMINE